MTHFAENQVTHDDARNAPVLDWLSTPAAYAEPLFGAYDARLDGIAREALIEGLQYLRVLVVAALKLKVDSSQRVGFVEHPEGFEVLAGDASVFLSAVRRQATFTRDRRTHRRNVEADARLLARTLRHIPDDRWKGIRAIYGCSRRSALFEGRSVGGALLRRLERDLFALDPSQIRRCDSERCAVVGGRFFVPVTSEHVCAECKRIKRRTRSRDKRAAAKNVEVAPSGRRIRTRIRRNRPRRLVPTRRSKAPETVEINRLRGTVEAFQAERITAAAQVIAAENRVLRAGLQVPADLVRVLRRIRQAHEAGF